MERKMDFFVLAFLIVACSRRGYALVLGPDENTLGDLANKYGESSVEKNIYGRNSGA